MSAHRAWPFPKGLVAGAVMPVQLQRKEIVRNMKNKPSPAQDMTNDQNTKGFADRSTEKNDVLCTPFFKEKTSPTQIYAPQMAQMIAMTCPAVIVRVP